MNSGQYYPQSRGNPMTVQYPEYPDSLQSIHQVLQYDGLPRAQSDRSFMTSLPSLFSGNYNLSNGNNISMSHVALPWADQSQIATAYQGQDNYGYYSPPRVAGPGPDRQFLRGDVPRCMPDLMGIHDANSMTLGGYQENHFYETDSNGLDDHLASPRRSTTFNNTLDNSRDFARLSIDGIVSPKMECDSTEDEPILFDKQSPFHLPSRESSEDGGNNSHEMTAVEGDEPAVDEPYARLIYRALMSAPNHSMVLQEIYQWFRENTVKGSSDTKGWMNSIRHNLSMNAAFKKTERKIPGDETKKSTEWVLEDFAIKDGVQSTTRYRKGTSTKKFTKSDHPTLSKQLSGRHGGHKTAKQMLQRKRNEERNLSRLRGANSRVDNTRIGYSGVHAYAPQRQRSPLTPPHPEHIVPPNPYYLKPEQLDSPFDMYRLEDVQGVYNDDGPIFANHDQDLHFHNGLPLSNHPF